jgi:hypothetical protein
MSVVTPIMKCKRKECLTTVHSGPLHGSEVEDTITVTLH